MGGNALKNCVTKRRPRSEYLVIEKDVSNLLAKYFLDFRLPKYFDDKERFGDVDIVYVPNETFDIQQISKDLESKEYVRNGDIISIEFREFQIDLIKTT